MALESLFNAERNGWNKNRIDDTTVAYEQDDGNLSIVISKEQNGEYKISPYVSNDGAVEDAVLESNLDDAQGVIANWMLDHPYE